jgi:hypothetical protein
VLIGGQEAALERSAAELRHVYECGADHKHAYLGHRGRSTRDTDKPLDAVLFLHACERKAESGPSIQRVYTLCRTLSVRLVACLQARRVTKRVCFSVLAPAHVAVVAIWR